MVNDAKQEQKKEILRKIEISKKLLSYDNLYNFVIKFVKTNIQKYMLKKKGFKTTVVNRALSSLHRGSLEITITIPLNRILTMLITNLSSSFCPLDRVFRN